MFKFTIAVPSTTNAQNTTGGTVTTLAINKPSGLAVNDLMVAILEGDGGLGTETFSLSGWTAQASQNLNTIGTALAATVLYKTANSSDVAASNFTFTSSGGLTGIQGALLRITGANTSSPINAFTFTANIAGNNPTFTNGITPKANSLLVLCMAGVRFSAGVSNYAIVTSNPSWTEQADLSYQTDIIFAVATGLRAAATATGNSSVTASQSGSGRSGGIIFAISPATLITVSDTQSTTDAVNKSLKRNFADTQSTTDAVIKTKSRKWTNDAKNTSVWTDDQKK